MPGPLARGPSLRHANAIEISSFPPGNHHSEEPRTTGAAQEPQGTGEISLTNHTSKIVRKTRLASPFQDTGHTREIFRLS